MTLGGMMYASLMLKGFVCSYLTWSCSYLVMQALAELAVTYPINGAFTMYICRFVDPSWGFACGWQYAISWLTVLPFEISAGKSLPNSGRSAVSVTRHVSLTMAGGLPKSYRAKF